MDTPVSRERLFADSKLTIECLKISQQHEFHAEINSDNIIAIYKGKADFWVGTDSHKRISENKLFLLASGQTLKITPLSDSVIFIFKPVFPLKHYPCQISPRIKKHIKSAQEKATNNPFFHLLYINSLIKNMLSFLTYKMQDYLGHEEYQLLKTEELLLLLSNTYTIKDQVLFFMTSSNIKKHLKYYISDINLYELSQFIQKNHLSEIEN